MDDRALRLALEALLDEPTLKSAHRASIERGLADLSEQRLIPDERAYLWMLIEHYAASTTPAADPVTALITAFQDKLPSVDPSALSTAIHALVAGDAAQLDGKPLALTIERRGQIQIANLAERNVVMGDLTQLDISVHIPIPDARFETLMQAAFQYQTHERITNAAQQIDSERLLNRRLEGFVGRVAELADIRANIEMMRPTGGYILIKAMAGEGKSSIIAKLIHDSGIASTPHHFIALQTKGEYELGLVRSVVAQLILKHNLIVSYFPEESYPAMKAEFARILTALSKDGIQETIYLDGLDQLQPEGDGSRDLSFLSSQPPPGIVIVLGSRPNETLESLYVQHLVPYNLPPLNKKDALMIWRSVQPHLADHLLNDLYDALKGNALFVQSAAAIIRNQSVVNATSLIKQIEQNPDNLFGITLNRIKRLPFSKWDEIWKPLLALLLVTQEPLRLDVLGDLLGHDNDTLHDSMAVLGGLVSQGIDQRVALHHLLFRDYLAASVFNQREVIRWHQRLCDWCAMDLEAIWADARDPIEQARRVYARHHYVTHLTLAENWELLWNILDTGDYGEHKTRFDPSTRLYALDLDRGRESIVRMGLSNDGHIQNLPRLWKYSLLRTSLTSRVDQWPDELFEVLAILGRTKESLERIDLCSNPQKQIQLWCRLIQWCDKSQHVTIFSRIQQTISHISEVEQSNILILVVQTYVSLGNIDYATQIAYSINRDWSRAQALMIIAQTHASSGQVDHAVKIANSITFDPIRNKTLTIIAQVYVSNREFEQAIQTVRSIHSHWDRSESLGIIARAIASIGDFDRAIEIAYSIVLVPARAEALAAITKAAALTHQLDRATQIAHSISYAPSRVEAFIAIANTFILSGELISSYILLDQALANTHAITNQGRYIEALGSIAKTFASAGEFIRATTLAKSIDDNRKRIETLAEIAKIATMAGNTDYAINVAQSANNDEGCAEIFTAIAESAIMAGNIDYLMQIIPFLDLTQNRDNSLTTIAKTAASTEHFSIAITLANSITNNKTRIETLSAVASILAAVGHLDDATRILEQLSSDIQSPSLLPIRIRVLTSITKIYALAGLLEPAIQIALSIDNSENRSDAFTAIANAAIHTGLLELAVQIVPSIDNVGNRDEITATIAQAYATLGNLEQAISLVESIDTHFIRVEAFTAIAKAATDAGYLHLEPAFTHPKSFEVTHSEDVLLHLQTIIASGSLRDTIKIIESIDALDIRVKALNIITKTAINLDNLEQAGHFAKFINRPDVRTEMLMAIAKTSANLGNLGYAINLAKAFSNQQHRTECFISIAQAAINTDNLDSVIQLTQSIDNTEIRSDGLAAIARIISTIGNLNYAIHIIKTIENDRIRIDALGSITQIESQCGIIPLIHTQWKNSKTHYDIWNYLPLISALIKGNPWLGTAILEEEGWVNEQLKRLG